MYGDGSEQQKKLPEGGIDMNALVVLREIRRPTRSLGCEIWSFDFKLPVTVTLPEGEFLKISFVIHRNFDTMSKRRWGETVDITVKAKDAPYDGLGQEDDHLDIPDFLVKDAVTYFLAQKHKLRNEKLLILKQLLFESLKKTRTSVLEVWGDLPKDDFLKYDIIMATE